MEYVTKVMKEESIKSFQSTIRKSEKALAQMTEKGANTTLIKKRLHALYIGLAVLEHAWHEKPYHYSPEEIVEAREILTGLMPSIQSIYAKTKVGSPQKTLLERRMKSLELAVQAIDVLFDK